jgi:hypothetical protein
MSKKKEAMELGMLERQAKSQQKVVSGKLHVLRTKNDVLYAMGITNSWSYLLQLKY